MAHLFPSTVARPLYFKRQEIYAEHLVQFFFLHEASFLRQPGRGHGPSTLAWGKSALCVQGVDRTSHRCHCYFHVFGQDCPFFHVANLGFLGKRQTQNCGLILAVHQRRLGLFRSTVLESHAGFASLLLKFQTKGEEMDVCTERVFLDSERDLG